MKKICGIYKITSPTGRIYIGQSVNISRRKTKYKRQDCRDQNKLFNSIFKYGWSAHKFEIIHECEIAELNKLEKYYVDLYQSFNTAHGMNLRDGGGKSAGTSEETRKKLSIALKGKYCGEKNSNFGRKASDETRKKLSMALKGKYCGEKSHWFGKKASEKTKKRMSAAHLGFKHSPDSLKKMSIKQKGKKRTEALKKRLSEIHKGTCMGEKNSNIRIILNRENGCFYFGLEEAATSICRSAGYLCTRLRGRKPNATPLIYV